MNNRDFIQQQQLWMRPLVAGAFRSCALSGQVDWKKHLHNYLMAGLTPTYICSLTPSMALSGCFETATLSLQVMARHSFGTEILKIEVGLNNPFEGMFDKQEDHSAHSSYRSFYQFVVDFLRSYDLYERDGKVSPFDQRAWDAMILQFWQSKLRSFRVTDDLDEPSETSHNIHPTYFATLKDKQRLTNTVATWQKFTVPAETSTEPIADQLATQVFSNVVKEIGNRVNPSSTLPCQPLLATPTLLGILDKDTTSCWGNQALQAILHEFGPQTVPTEPRPVKWGLPLEPRKTFDQTIGQSGAEQREQHEQPEQVFIDGIPVGDFRSYASDPSAVASCDGNRATALALNECPKQEAAKTGRMVQWKEVLQLQPDASCSVKYLSFVVPNEILDKTDNKNNESDVETTDPDLLDDFGEKVAFEERKSPWGAPACLITSAVEKVISESDIPPGQDPNVERYQTGNCRIRSQDIQGILAVLSSSLRELPDQKIQLCLACNTALLYNSQESAG
ncbi:hypothetical protein BV898_07222 [Hypsibius exemplaris]|uniref:Uncharacterized protein n=1 Tax=Hypsibius exemplaris TaxID=2072580 RepID=A0A1W0WUA9_HYPEX|nr:hypothetical protein BV898_07222 [Hypsibius exemplaris]